MRTMRDNDASDDHYAVLGITRGATTAEIQRAYLHLARKYHPDLQLAAERPAAIERFTTMAEARRVLTDPVLRSRYDALDRSSGQTLDPMALRPVRPAIAAARR
jgi:DnaJ-class molecular chaperone